MSRRDAESVELLFLFPSTQDHARLPGGIRIVDDCEREVITWALQGRGEDPLMFSEPATVDPACKKSSIDRGPLWTRRTGSSRHSGKVFQAQEKTEWQS